MGIVNKIKDYCGVNIKKYVGRKTAKEIEKAEIVLLELQNIDEGFYFRYVDADGKRTWDNIIDGLASWYKEYQGNGTDVCSEDMVYIRETDSLYVNDDLIQDSRNRYCPIGEIDSNAKLVMSGDNGVVTFGGDRIEFAQTEYGTFVKINGDYAGREWTEKLKKFLIQKNVWKEKSCDPK